MSMGKAWKPEEKEKIVQTMRPYFELGYSVKKACVLAQFPDSTFYLWLKDDPSLWARIKAWQGIVSEQARKTLAKSVKAGDKNDAKWWLERQEKEDFSTRSEVTGKDGADLINIEDKVKEKVDKALDEFINKKDTGPRVSTGEESVVSILPAGLHR